MTMNVLLINPPSPYLENDAAYPPMGLMYVASALEKEGCKVKIMDMAGGNSEQVRIPSDTELVGFTCVTPNANTVRKMVRQIPHYIPVMVGGPHPTFVQNENDLGSVQVRGEFELVAPFLISDAISKRLKGTYEGMLVPPNKMISPARHLVDLHRYRPGGEDATPIYASRGCSYNCAFCSKISKNTYRAVPVELVVTDIDRCVYAGYKNIILADDNFFLNKNALTILDYVHHIHNVNLRINTDARRVTRDNIKAAKAAGCTSISMGIESGSQTILNLMNKQTTVRKNLESIQIIKEAGIAVKIYLICNFPGETSQTIDETIEFVRKAQPDSVLISNFAPLPGSQVYDHPERFGVTYMSGNWDDYYLVGKNGGFAPCFEAEGLKANQQLFNHLKLRTAMIDEGYVK